tara:strand:+ start:979 stop:1152 length:174 start_codon:yes stop_codon:yes gene_type:complete
MISNKGMMLIQKGIKFMEHFHAKTLTEQLAAETLSVVEEIRLYDPVLAHDIIASLPE